MTGLAIINIALGIAFVYTVFALLCSVLNGVDSPHAVLETTCSQSGD